MIITFSLVKEDFNLWKLSNKAPFFLKSIFILVGAVLISYFINIEQVLSTNFLISFILIQTIIITWLQTLLGVGSKILFLNKVTMPILMGANIYENIISYSIYLTYKSSIIGLAIAIIFSQSLFQIPIYFLVFVFSSLLSFQLAMSMLVGWLRFIKSLNYLIVIMFLGQIILLGVLIYLIMTNYQMQVINGYFQTINLTMVIYFLISLIPIIIYILKPQKFNQFYMKSINNFCHQHKKTKVESSRWTFTSKFKNPVVYKDTILVLTNPLTKVRGYLWGIIQLLMIYLILNYEVITLTGYLPFSSDQAEWFILHSSIIVTYILFGEVVLSLFQTEKGIIRWYSITGFNSNKLLLSKIILGFSMLLIPSVISILTYSFLLYVNIGQIIIIISLAIICLLTITTIILSISFLEVEPKKFSEPLDHLTITEQIPQTQITLGSLFIGFILLGLFYLFLYRQPILGIFDFLMIIITVILSILFFILGHKVFKKRDTRIKLQ